MNADAEPNLVKHMGAISCRIVDADRQRIARSKRSLRACLDRAAHGLEALLAVAFIAFAVSAITGRSFDSARSRISRHSRSSATPSTKELGDDQMDVSAA
jgi:hypothetical protein